MPPAAACSARSWPSTATSARASPGRCAACSAGWTASSGGRCRTSRDGLVDLSRRSVVHRLPPWTTATTCCSAPSSRPSRRARARVVALARLTEQVGLDLVSVQDHPYQPRFLDTWTLLSVIARDHGADPAGPERREPAAAPAGGAGPQRREPRPAHRRPGRAGPRRRRVLGRDRRRRRAAARRRARRSRRSRRRSRIIRAVWDAGRRRSGSTASTTGCAARTPVRRRRTTSASGSAPTSRGCSR